MARKKLIITARINEYMPRQPNPHVPFTPDEIAETAAACRAAGASLIHFHARNPDGSPSHDPAVYAEIVAKIRARTDVLIDSTLGQITVKEDAARVAHIEHMGGAGTPKPDFAALDTGSTNIDAYDFAAHRFVTTNKVYRNATETCLFLARKIRESGVKPHLSVWAVPFLRTVDAFLDMGAVEQPAYVQLVLTEGGILGGHPATVKGVEAYLDFMPTRHRIEWTVCCKEGNLFSAAAVAIERDGHVAPGIGDYPYPELGCPSNEALVARMAELGRAMGREVATTDEARAMLGITR
ncbi:MAG: 3-keto-5-aminohexanoate cleavage protein [Alphaproteobacteria bacterium]|nr:3-keto-5-aminohexanoate cleavage protein [Alphaproteobacteria bacterium]